MEASARPGLVRGLVAAGYAYGTCASLLSELLTRGWHCAILGAGLVKAGLAQKGVKMSAYIVGDTHITAMVKSIYPRYPGQSASYRYNEERRPMYGRGQELGTVLKAQNYRSVNYRYDENEPVEEFRLDPRAPSLEPVAILQACACYDYQACETPDYEETEAWAIVDAIRFWAIKALPGYDEAEAWPVRVSDEG